MQQKNIALIKEKVSTQEIIKIPN